MKRLVMLLCVATLTFGVMGCATNNSPSPDSNGGAGNWGSKSGPTQGTATGNLGGAEGTGGGGGDLGTHTNR